MENDVLKQDRELLETLKAKAFSGHINSETRARLETLYKEKTGANSNVCWTCSGSVYNFAKNLLNCL